MVLARKVNVFWFDQGPPVGGNVMQPSMQRNAATILDWCNVSKVFAPALDSHFGYVATCPVMSSKTFQAR